MLSIDWTEQAAGQLSQVHDYIALSSTEETAVRITSRVIGAIQRLGNFPLAGRVGRIRGTRELVISNTPFIAAYAVENKRVVVLAIYHGAQQWPDVL